jgi:hypothetical protein
VVFDPTYTDVDMRAFIKKDWKPMYGDIKEAIPPNAPVTRGKAIGLHLFVDSDHAGEHFTRHSRTGFVLYLNMAPIVWFSKRQPTVESSLFGAEFVAIKNSIETTRGLRYKLRMTGLLIPQVRQVHKYPNPPWEMMHLPVGDNALCAPPYTVYTAVCNNSLTATYQYKISNPSNKVLVNNN